MALKIEASRRLKVTAAPKSKFPQDEGYDAGYKGNPRNSNPYGSGTLDGNNWFRGWAAGKEDHEAENE